MSADIAPDTAGEPGWSLHERAASLAARYEWQLVPAAELASLVAEEIRRAGAALGPREVDQLTTAVYVEQLHRACSGARGAELRQRGYIELAGFLVSVARKKYSDVADEAAQAALVATFESFERCRMPRAFLLFAQQRLYTAVRQLRRESGSLSLDQELADGILLAETVAAPEADPAEQMIAREVAADIQAAIARSHALHPRARLQLQAFFDKHLEGLSDAEIGERLRHDAVQVPVLRSRGASKLREDDHWRAIRDGIADDPAPAPQADLTSAI